MDIKRDDSKNKTEQIYPLYGDHGILIPWSPVKGIVCSASFHFNAAIFLFKVRKIHNRFKTFLNIS